MIRNAGARRGGIDPGTVRAALIAAALLALTAGCGQFNDDPFNGGFIVRLGFDESAQQSATAGAGAVTPQGVTAPAGSGIVTLVVGPIVITHVKSTSVGGGIEAYVFADIVLINDTDRENLEQDALQSVQFLEIVQLPHPSDTVEFEIPPDNAGPWQLIAVGLQVRRETLEAITDTDPIWYGFTPEFLNDNVRRGQTQFTLTLAEALGL